MIDRHSSIVIAILVSWYVVGDIPLALGQPPEQLFSNENNDNAQQPPREADAQAGDVAGQAPQNAPQASTPQPTESQMPPPRQHHRK